MSDNETTPVWSTPVAADGTSEPKSDTQKDDAPQGDVTTSQDAPQETQEPSLLASAEEELRKAEVEVERLREHVARVAHEEHSRMTRSLYHIGYPGEGSHRGPRAEEILGR